MLHVQRAVFSTAFVLATLMLVAGCGKPAAPPPGAPDDASSPTINQGTESEPGADESTSGDSESAPSDTSAGEAETGWGTLTGRIVFDGTAPAPQTIDTSKDPNCKAELKTEDILVSEDGGLANAVVMLRTKDVPVAPEYEETANAEVSLTNKDCRFEPHVQVVRLSQTLLLKNDDPTGHNTNISPFKNLAINPILAVGADPIPYNFSIEEGFPVKVGCNIHPWMGGWIVARKDPYAAVTDKDGTFTIKDLPAGRDLEFRLWQESPGNLKNATYKGGKTDSKGIFKIKLKPGENNLGDIKVSSSIFKK